MEGTRQELGQTKGGLDKSVESTSNEVTTLMFVGACFIVITEE